MYVSIVKIIAILAACSDIFTMILFFLLVTVGFSILQTKAEKEGHLSMIKNGQLDIVVGTHALLGNRVVYSNLGLLVVDEEQVLPSFYMTLYILMPISLII